MVKALPKLTLSEEAQALLKKWSIIAGIVGVLSGGSAMAVFNFAADWVELNSRPGEIVSATNAFPLMSDDLYFLEHRYCRRFPSDCER